MTTPNFASTVYSATPTPLMEGGGIDESSVKRCIEHHVALGCNGVMLAGTCGEGPWLRDSDLESLVKTGLAQAGKRLKIGAQVTDNSPGRILDRLTELADWNADFGVVAQPYFFMNATPRRLVDFYHEIFEHSPLPLFFYDRGKASAVFVPTEILGEIAAHPRLIGVKDSACDAERFAAISAIRQQRDDFVVLAGNEFGLIDALKSGYDGAFFGGAVLTGGVVRKTLELFAAGKLDEARELDAAAQEVLLAAYGGPKITCWLSGLKYMLIRLGVFAGWQNIPGYPLTEECRAAVEKAVDEVKWLRPQVSVTA